MKNNSKDAFHEDLIEILSIYHYSTLINCRALKMSDMEKIHIVDNQPAFCKMVNSCDKGESDCCKSYIYGGRQAEKLGEYYIYFCPYGLINWAVPVIVENQMDYIVVGGPTLIHPVDDLLIENIYEQNPILKEKYKQGIREDLKKLPYVDPVRTRYLAEILLRLVQGITDNLSLDQRSKNKDIGSHLAETIHQLKKQNSQNKNTLYPIEKENELILRVKAADNQGARMILNQILGHIFFYNGNDFEIVKVKAIELMGVLARSAVEIGADLEIISNLEYMLYEKLNNVKDINELSEELTGILDRFIESTFIISNVKSKDIIYKAMYFIRNNYYNNDLTLNNVADEIGLSTSYFSKLFKERTGLSYSDYLNKVRVTAGKELLKKNIAISEIAQTVGFNDQSYFSKVFKKITGVSPGSYR